MRRLCPRMCTYAGMAILLAAASVCYASLGPEVLARVKDAVVLVEVNLEASATGDKASGAGSGFVISAEGMIVTNAHVVAPEIEKESGRTVVADKRMVTVTFHPNTPRERSFPAQVLRENAELDLALLKIESATPTYLELADSDKVYETQPVFVCGHPLGFPEISIRSGTVTATRTWQGSKYIEHDAAAESGNSGGPLVDEQGRVVGVHTLTIAASSMLTKFAIPSNVVDVWLKSAPAQDPIREAPGSRVRKMLARSDLYYSDEGDGVFSLPYDNNVTVYMHEYQDFLRGYVDLGYLPGDNESQQGLVALLALRLNFNDPIGRLSAYRNEDGEYELYWEFQAPISAVNPKFVRFVGRVGAWQAGRWRGLLDDVNFSGPQEMDIPVDVEEHLFDKLGELLEKTGLVYKRDDEKQRYVLPYENDGDEEGSVINVTMRVYRSMVWTFTYLGGMPGKTEAERNKIAIELLERNWDDPFGRLSLDSDLDLLWESQVPMDFLTPDYLAILANTCASQAASFKKTYGFTPFNG